MAGILKNQILKLLSKFAKNISPSSLNVSALKGEGELHDLELNEKVLTELLELPSWMQISHAHVNKVSVKIQWTKLKSTPIQMILDEVRVNMETCNELRPPDIAQDIGSYKSGGSYGFSDKVIDGLSVSVNAVYIEFKSSSFIATLQLSRLILCSKSPDWQKVDLRSTRLKDPHQQHVLIFKELRWDTLKLEAKSIKHDLIPVRLITSLGYCRITIKKKLVDCSVVGCRLVLIMNDIMWVLTDSQLLASYHFVNSLSDLIKKATEESQNVKAARKLESIPSYQPLQSQNLGDYGLGIQAHPLGKDEASRGGFWNAPTPAQLQYKLHIFEKFDVVETSYHFVSDKIELHFLDDSGPGRSTYPELKDGGDLQVSVTKVKIDYYPYHLATGDRTHWIKYDEGSPYQWTKLALNQFKNRLFDCFSGKSSHAPLGRASPHVRSNSIQSHTTAASIRTEMEFTKDNKDSFSTSSSKTFVSNQFRKLMSTCCIVTCQDVVVYGVAPSKSKAPPKEMMFGDRTKYALPLTTPFVQLEISYYFYPGGFSFPVPSPKIYMHVSPLCVVFDMKSILWLNAFACHLKKRVNGNGQQPPYLDIHIEAIMPRIIMEPILGSVSTMEGSWKAIQTKVSRALISNVREVDPKSAGSKASLFTCLDAAQDGELFFGSQFPSKVEDFHAIPSKFLNHATGNDCLRSYSSSDAKFHPPYEGLHSQSLWTESRDVFFLYLNPVWVEFLEPPFAKDKTIMFIDAFPLSIWLYVKELTLLPSSLASSPVPVTPNETEKRLRGVFSYNEPNSSDSAEMCEEASLHMLAYVPTLVNVQLNHQQYVLLLRILDTVAEFTAFFTEDTKEIMRNGTESLLVAVVLPQIDISLLISSQTLPEDSMLTGPVSHMNFGECSLSNQPISEDSYSIVPEQPSFVDHIPISHSLQETTKVPSPLVTRESHFSIHYKEPIVSDMNVHKEVDSTVKPCSNEVLTGSSYPAASTYNDVPFGSEEDLEADGCGVSNSHSVGCLAESTPPPHSNNIASLTTSPINAASSAVNCAPNTDIVLIHDDGIERNVIIPTPQRKSYGFSYMKKGLTSGINALRNTLDYNVKSPEDDAISIHSDMSNESDNYVMLYMDDKQVGGESLFQVGDKGDHHIERADEAVEASSFNPTDASSQFINDLVSVLSLRLGKVQSVYEGEGHNSSIKLQLTSIDCEELSEISLREFQASFGQKSRNWVPFNAVGQPCTFKLRLDTQAASIRTPTGESATPVQQTDCFNSNFYSNGIPPTNKSFRNDSSGRRTTEEASFHPSESADSMRTQTPGYLEGRYSASLPIERLSSFETEIVKVNLSLHTTSLTAVVDFIEDDLSQRPLPFEAKLREVVLQLNEEKKFSNTLCPLSYKVSIPEMRATRDEDFNVTIWPMIESKSDKRASKISSSIDSDATVAKLKSELEEIKNKLRDSEDENLNLQKALKILQGDSSY